MLRVGLRRQHLVEAVGGLVDDPLLGSEDLHAARERRTHSHHVSGYVEYDGGLLAVGSAAVHLGAFLAVTAAEQKRHSRRKLRFAHFLRYLHISRVELPVPVRLQYAEQVADDLLLPVDQFKGLSRPCAFGMAQRLDEHDRIIGGILVIVGVLRLELRRLVFLQFSYCHARHNLPDGIKNSRRHSWCDLRHIRGTEPVGSAPSRFLFPAFQPISMPP